MNKELYKYIILTSIIGFLILYLFIFIQIFSINNKFVNDIYNRFININKIVRVYSDNLIIPKIEDSKHQEYIVVNNSSSLGVDYTKKKYFNNFINYDFINVKTNKKIKGYFNKKCLFVDKSNKKHKLYLYLDNKKIICKDKNIFSINNINFSGYITGSGLIYINDEMYIKDIIFSKMNYFLKYYVFEYLYSNNYYLINKYVKDKNLRIELLKKKKIYKHYKYGINEIEDFSDYKNNYFYYKIKYWEREINDNQLSITLKKKKILKIKIEVDKFINNGLNLKIVYFENTYDMSKQDKNKLYQIIKNNIYQLFNGKYINKTVTIKKLMKKNLISDKKIQKIITEIIGNNKIIELNSIIIDKGKGENNYIVKISLTNALNDNIRYNFYFEKENVKNEMFYLQKIEKVK